MWRPAGEDIRIDHYVNSRRSILLFVIIVYSLGIIGRYFLLVTDGVVNSLNQLTYIINDLEIKNEQVKRRLSLITSQDVSETEKENKVLQSVFERAEVVFMDLERYRTGLGRRMTKHRIEAELTRKLSTSLTRLSYDHEKSRRKLENLFRELWFFIDAFPFDQAKTSDVNGNANIKEDANFYDAKAKMLNNYEQAGYDIFKSKVKGYKRSISLALDRLRRSDNLDDDRLAMSKELGALVQRRLKDLQNPSDCDSARYLFCPSKACGFGCVIHHHVQCLIMAYATGRVLVTSMVDTMAGGEDPGQVFQPLSARCKTDNFSLSDMYEGSDFERELAGSGKSDERVLKYSIIDYASEDDKKMLPLAVPADLAPKLTLFHGNPPAWWVGQIAAYVMRQTPKYQQELNELKERLGLEGHYVGIHVRRTDKIIEAAYHQLEEYMAHVHDYFEQLETPPKTRRVFLASDEDLLSEAVRKFPGYEFINNQNATKSRESVEGLKGLITDITFLADARYLVCTFSSQVCRLAYELMQTKHGDASSWFRSLDDIYYFGGQYRHLVRAVEPSEEGEGPDGVKIMGLKKGDLVHTAGNHWNGYSKGTHLDTGDVGLYPTYKTEDVLDYTCLPEYPHIPTDSQVPYI